MNKKDYELIAKCLGQTIKDFVEENADTDMTKQMVGNFYKRIVTCLAKDNRNFNYVAFRNATRAEADK